jgi:hypothetical protein
VTAMCLQMFWKDAAHVQARCYYMLHLVLFLDAC